MMTCFLHAATALALVLAAVGCGGKGRSDKVETSAAELTTLEIAQKCDVLFAAGATLPEVMPELCARGRGDLLAVVYITCADPRRLYQVDVSAGQAWAFSGGVVTVGQDIAGSPEYRAAYDDCVG